MRAPFEMTVGLKRLKTIVATLPPDSPHWNEAQNRFQYIDRLLAECLGWTKPEMRVEHPDGAGGRVDYELGDPPKAVLEAKREAVVFKTLPTGAPSMVRKLAPLIAASLEFKAAAGQVVGYCAMRGAQVAVVCNGPQLIIFQALTAGLPPLEGECFMFNGFDTQIDHFPLLWTLLSPEGISENRAFRDLALHRNPRIPQKASTAIPDSTKFRYRSDLQENLRGLSSRLLEEIEDNPKLKKAFYRDCYVPIEANSRHLLLSKNIIAARYKRAGDTGVVPLALQMEDLDADTGALMSMVGSRPIVVIGDVGVGKTSFFENLFESLGGTESSDSYFIHIDLGTKANLTADIKEYILNEIPGTLKKKYGIDIEELEFVETIYHFELIAFDKSVKGALKKTNPEAYEEARINFLVEKTEQRDHHLHASLGHLARGRKKQIILILDNGDQRTFDVQQEAFLIGQELAATRNLLVFVALRPSTFYLSKATGALSGYQNRLLTISPPPADEVIERRLTFAVRIAEGHIEPGFLAGIQLHFGNVVAFLKATLRSVRESEQIRRFLSNITGGNRFRLESRHERDCTG
jgi:GTPase SAR1 family protein